MFVGRTFPSLENAVTILISESKNEGYNIRKDTIKKNNGIPYYQVLVCSRSGSAPKKKLQSKIEQQKEKTSQRCNCPYRVCLRRNKKTNEFFISKFFDKHCVACTPSFRTVLSGYNYPNPNEIITASAFTPTINRKMAENPHKRRRKTKDPPEIHIPVIMASIPQSNCPTIPYATTIPSISPPIPSIII